MRQVIRIEKVTKRYGQEYLVEDLNLTVKEGETIGFVGTPDKTLEVMKLLSGEVMPCKGEIYYDEERLGQYGQTPDYVGVYIEPIGFLEEFTGYKNLKYIAGMNGTANEKEITVAMEFVGLNPESNWKVRQYTARMLQKLSISQALMEGQSVLLLHGDLFSMDNIENHAELCRIISKLKKCGFTIVLAAQEHRFIEKICHQIHRID